MNHLDAFRSIAPDLPAVVRLSSTQELRALHGRLARITHRPYAFLLPREALSSADAANTTGFRFGRCRVLALPVDARRLARVAAELGAI